MRIPFLSLACVGALGFFGAAYAQQSGERLTVPFSDPTRPGTLHVSLVTGGITIKGSDRKDVIIEARPRANSAPREASTAPGGLRRLEQQPSFAVEEENNRMEIGSSNVNRAFDFDIQVPVHTHLAIGTINGGNILVEAVDGELEISNVNGSITLNKVGGSIVAHTVNGRVLATLTRVTAKKSMAFTSLNGAVDVTFPASIQANLKLRSDQGEVFTDFDLQIRPQDTAPTVQDTGRPGGRYRIEVNKLVHGAVNGGGPEIELRTFNGNVYVRKGS